MGAKQPKPGYRTNAHNGSDAAIRLFAVRHVQTRTVESSRYGGNLSLAFALRKDAPRTFR